MRWPMPDPAEFDDEQRTTYDRVCGRQHTLWSTGGPGAYFGPLLLSPEMGGMISDLGAFFKTGGKRGTLPDDAREFADLVCGVELRSGSIFAGHTPDAVAVGVRPEAAAALWRGDDAALTDDERELAEFVRAVVAGTATDDDCAVMRRRYGDRGAIELTTFVTFLCMTARLMDAVGIPSPPAEKVDALIQTFVDGTAEVPDPAARTG